MSSRSFLGRGILVVALLAAGRAEGGDGGDGFLFRAPRGTVSFRGGLDRAAAGSDLFAFTVNQLTIDRQDFSAATFTTDVDYGLTPRVAMRFSVGISRSTTPSEFRDFVDSDRRPIEQTTGFTRVPLTASVKMYLLRPGRAIGRFAWVPARYSPYVGAGGGGMWYQFKQQGDFIDFATNKVFSDAFVSQGWAPTVQAFIGTDVSLSPRVMVTMEGRYQRARAQLGLDFSRFDRIDLSGVVLSAGLSFRY